MSNIRRVNESKCLEYVENNVGLKTNNLGRVTHFQCLHEHIHHISDRVFWPVTECFLHRPAHSRKYSEDDIVQLKLCEQRQCMVAAKQARRSRHNFSEDL
jgi:hypothetical protein